MYTGKESIFVRNEGNNLCSLKSCVTFHLVTSHTPCKFFFFRDKKGGGGLHRQWIPAFTLTVPPNLPLFEQFFKIGQN